MHTRPRPAPQAQLQEARDSFNSASSELGELRVVYGKLEATAKVGARRGLEGPPRAWGLGPARLAPHGQRRCPVEAPGLAGRRLPTAPPPLQVLRDTAEGASRELAEQLTKSREATTALEKQKEKAARWR
jgi:hypothetical protein